MINNQPSFMNLTIKTIVVHTVTYFLMGVLAYYGLDYAERFTRPEMACWMRPVNDPLIMAGPLFQPIRGLIFAMVFFPLREILFGKKNGWLVMWWTLVALGILSTFGPAPASVEGMLYTVIPIPDQLAGWLEVVPQALLLSAILFYWVNHSENKWLNWVMGGLFFLLVLMTVAGLLARTT